MTPNDFIEIEVSTFQFNDAHLESSLDLAHSAVDHEFDSSDEAGLIGCREGAAAAISLDQPDRPGRIGCVEEMAAAARAVFGQQTGNDL
jgi:hypothetical protein